MDTQVKDYTKHIEEWKNKYGDVYELIIDDKKGYVRKPTRVEWRHAYAVAITGNGSLNPMLLGETLLKDCWLGGDKEIMENDDYYIPSILKITDLFQIKQAELKKI